MDLREIGWVGMDSIDLAQDWDQGRTFDSLHNWRLLKKDSDAWSQL
jgi:hypothetical protein